MKAINKPSGSKIRLAFWRWHRRVGLVAALFVLLLAVTGILLNHTAALRLDRGKLSPQWLEVFYGLDSPVMVSYRLEDSWFSQVAGEAIYQEAELIFNCQGPLVGALVYGRFRVLACEQQLVVLTSDGSQVVERLSASHGLPAPVRGLAPCDNQICLRGDAGLHRLDLAALTWTPVSENPADLAWSTPVATPEDLRRRLGEIHLGQTISWERLLLDMHSGRILGSWGVWLMDLMAILFLLLAVTGVAMWSMGRRKRVRAGGGKA